MLVYLAHRAELDVRVRVAAARCWHGVPIFQQQAQNNKNKPMLYLLLLYPASHAPVSRHHLRTAVLKPFRNNGHTPCEELNHVCCCSLFFFCLPSRSTTLHTHATHKKKRTTTAVQQKHLTEGQVAKLHRFHQSINQSPIIAAASTKAQSTGSSPKPPLSTPPH